MDRFACARNIKLELERIGKSPSWLAQEIGVTDGTMTRWLRVERQPTAYGLYKVAKVLGVSMESLMQGVDGENENFKY